MRERQVKINKENRSVSKHLNDFQGMVNQESNMKWDNWDTLVILLSNSSPHVVLILNIIKDNMFNEESRIKEYGIPIEFQY